MELIGSLLFIVAIALAVALFVSQPFLGRGKKIYPDGALTQQSRDHERSALLAERDRTLSALHELDFDFTLGKVPQEDYQGQRTVLLQNGAEVLRKLDAIGADSNRVEGGMDRPAPETVEERIEAAVAARRADVGTRSRPAGATAEKGGRPATGVRGDDVEELIASRKRQRNESSAGFCPHCGRPVQKSDKFCSKCGADL